MANFVWIIPRDKEEALGAHGVASSYLVPRNLWKQEAFALEHATVWVVLRGEAYRLALVIRVRAADRILDGYHKDDVLLTTDICESIKLGSNYGNLTAFDLDFSEVMQEGLLEIPDDLAIHFSKVMEKNLFVRLVPPTNRSLSEIKIDLLPKKPAMLVRALYQAITSSLNLKDIWSDGKNKEYRSKPFASVLRAYVQAQLPQIDYKGIEEEVLKRDPFFNLTDSNVAARDVSQENLNSGFFRFDDLFRPIIPELIYARAFSPGEVSRLDFHASIKKTEAAERKHQEILKDVSKYLLWQNIRVFQSASIDLAYCSSGTLNILEIKTAHPENAASQAAKGIFQLAAYMNALDSSFAKISPILLIEKTYRESLDVFLCQTAASLGIKTLFYDARLGWPDRVKELPLPLC